MPSAPGRRGRHGPVRYPRISVLIRDCRALGLDGYAMLVSFNKGRCPDVIGYRPSHSGSILNTPGEHSDTHVLELFAAGRRERV